MHNKTHCGFIAIVGRPNVGKSTLLNRLLGEKLSITSRKPQTTRHKILGIKTEGLQQLIFIDTPGIHHAAKTELNHFMNRTASSVFSDVDAIVLVLDATRWLADDEWVINKLTHAKCPIILALNKIDKLKDKSTLLPKLEELSKKLPFHAQVPLSAKTGMGADKLKNVLLQLLPESPFFYAADAITDRSERFIAAEIIREKLMRGIGQELPYSITVEIEEFRQDGKLLRISGLIWVDKASHKIIVIGSDGERLKAIGQAARIDLEARFKHKVFLRLWVKVKRGWANDIRALKSLGYED